jgi:hypothetical protein
MTGDSHAWVAARFHAILIASGDFGEGSTKTGGMKFDPSGVAGFVYGRSNLIIKRLSGCA